MDYIACAEDAKGIRRERVLDLAYRLCFYAHPQRTQPRCRKLWHHLEGFLRDCIEQGATGWDDGPVYVCDYFAESFDDLATYSGYRIETGREHRFYDTMMYIARTAIDAADGFPGGTFGMSIGEFKRIYAGRLPEWWNGGWADKEGNLVDLNLISEDVVLLI